MTEHQTSALKGQVKIAIQQQKKLDDLEEQTAATAKRLRSTLSLIGDWIQTEREPIIVRFGSKIYHVAPSPTTNPVAPVDIREAKLVA